MTLKELCKKSHDMAVEKGFWDSDRNKAELLMLVVSELGEACEALRKTHDGERLRVIKTGLWVKDSYADEIADCFIRLADLCQAQGIDIEWQIEQKMAYNKTRSLKHGKRF